MSFSGDVKEELLEQRIEGRCCQGVFLYCALKNCGAVERDSGGMRINIRAFSMSFVRAVGSIVKKLFGTAVSGIYKNSDVLSGRDYYQCVIEGDCDCLSILRELELRPGLFAAVPPSDRLLSELSRECCARTFLRATVLTAGYFQDPTKSYHFEIRLADPFLANIARRLFRDLARLNLRTHIIKDDGTILMYSKSFEDLERVLASTGATSCHLRAEDVKILKEIKNNTNRSVNFETANLERTSSAASEQIARIKAVMRSRHADKLTKPLLEISKLRITHPHMSLVQLARLTRPRVSKSAVNGRLNKILEIYARYEKEMPPLQ